MLYQLHFTPFAPVSLRLTSANPQTVTFPQVFYLNANDRNLYT
jgi:hypothetical protein